MHPAFTLFMMHLNGELLRWSYDDGPADTSVTRIFLTEELRRWESEMEHVFSLISEKEHDLPVNLMTVNVGLSKLLMQLHEALLRHCVDYAVAYSLRMVSLGEDGVPAPYPIKETVREDLPSLRDVHDNG